MRKKTARFLLITLLSTLAFSSYGWTKQASCLPNSVTCEADSMIPMQADEQARLDSILLPINAGELEAMQSTYALPPLMVTPATKEQEAALWTAAKQKALGGMMHDFVAFLKHFYSLEQREFVALQLVHRPAQKSFALEEGIVLRLSHFSVADRAMMRMAAGMSSAHSNVLNALLRESVDTTQRKQRQLTLCCDSEDKAIQPITLPATTDDGTKKEAWVKNVGAFLLQCFDHTSKEGVVRIQAAIY